MNIASGAGIRLAEISQPACYALLVLALLSGGAAHAQNTLVQNVPLDIPFSHFGSKEAAEAWKDAKGRNAEKRDTAVMSKDIAVRRKLQDDWYNSLTEKQKKHYAVDIRPQVISGVYTEVFTPADGISKANDRKVLINLHGGGFDMGARTAGRVQSIPFASVAKIKVISVDYRMAPEYQFPAATEDVVAVYKALLKDYRPENIGIYGCSAGGTLTAQSVAWFIEKKIPMPGAIGMFCGTGEVWAKGDSAYFWAILNGNSLATAEHDPQNYSYLKGLNTDNPLIFPMRYPDMYRRFPPSLFITGTRSYEMSTLIDANNKLSAAGVPSELHIWDGMTHGFFYEPGLPESREVYNVTAKFFAKYLGRQRGP